MRNSMSLLAVLSMSGCLVPVIAGEDRFDAGSVGGGSGGGLIGGQGGGATGGGTGGGAACDPEMACLDLIGCFDGSAYPTSCGPKNCDSPIGPCGVGGGSGGSGGTGGGIGTGAGGGSTGTGGGFGTGAGGGSTGTGGGFGTGAGGGSTGTGGGFGTGAGGGSTGTGGGGSVGCDPQMVCSHLIICLGGSAYPTSCGPLNCDLPIGPCDFGGGPGGGTGGGSAGGTGGGSAGGTGGGSAQCSIPGDGLGCSSPFSAAASGMCDYDNTCMCFAGFALNSAGACALPTSPSCLLGDFDSCNDGTAAQTVGRCEVMANGVGCRCDDGYDTNPATGKCRPAGVTGKEVTYRMVNIGGTGPRLQIQREDRDVGHCAVITLGGAASPSGRFHNVGASPWSVDNIEYALSNCDHANDVSTTRFQAGFASGSIIVNGPVASLQVNVLFGPSGSGVTPPPTLRFLARNARLTP